jgi:DNA replication and repair protein RecF
MLLWIALRDFRSYPELTWRPEPGVNILVGPNGVGKTSLLEAIAYLGTMRSFRGAPDEALIAAGAESAVVRGEVTRGEGSALIEVELGRRRSRRARLDRKILPRVTDLLGVVRLVTFLPEDLEMVKGGPGARRDLLDELAVQLWPATHLDQAEFDRALRQRNSFLKGFDRPEATLEVWDLRLAQAAARVMGRRAWAAQALTARLEKIYEIVAGAPAAIELTYESDWGGTLDPSTPAAVWTEALAESLARRRRADLELRTTGAGPHRDDPVFRLAGRPARFQSSQGEQRTLALALRLASHEAITDQVGSPPLLLLDDVFSELDPERAHALTAALPDAQTMISTTRSEDVPLSGRSWLVSEGWRGD